MPTMLDAKRKWREVWTRTKDGARRAGGWRVAVAAVIVLGGGLFLFALAGLTMVVSSIATIVSLNQLFELGIEITEANVAAMIWLWLCAYVLALSARSKSSTKEEKR